MSLPDQTTKKIDSKVSKDGILLAGEDPSGNLKTVFVDGNDTDGNATGSSNFLKVITFNHEFNGTAWDRVRHSEHVETTGITTSAAGTAIDLSNFPFNIFSISVERTAGAAAIDVNLEGSLDNSNWTEIISNVTTVAGEVSFIADKPVRFLRYNVVDVGASNTLTINVLGMR